MSQIVPIPTHARIARRALMSAVRDVSDRCSIKHSHTARPNVDRINPQA